MRRWGAQSAAVQLALGRGSWSSLGCAASLRVRVSEMRGPLAVAPQDSFGGSVRRNPKDSG